MNKEQWYLFVYFQVLSSIMPTAFKKQKYSSIRSECLSKGTLFEDPEFPANNKSIFFSKIDNEIEWKRPKVSKNLMVPTSPPL